MSCSIERFDRVLQAESFLFFLSLTNVAHHKNKWTEANHWFIGISFITFSHLQESTDEIKMICLSFKLRLGIFDSIFSKNTFSYFSLSHWRTMYYLSILNVFWWFYCLERKIMKVKGSHFLSSIGIIYIYTNDLCSNDEGNFFVSNLILFFKCAMMKPRRRVD